MAKPVQPHSAEIVTRLRRGENPIDIARRFGLSLVNLAQIAEENGLILSAERFHGSNPVNAGQALDRPLQPERLRNVE